MIKLEIDGKPVEVKSGSMIIEAADQVKSHIPRFCYHKKLSIAANCRMCLVEVERAPKPLPACATPVTEGMKVFTQSKATLDAQKSVMEFLLINHPLDCPICDQGGECELQDNAMGYGPEISRFTEGKRVVTDKDIGPLIATDLTRCIHCTRCVRFSEEIVGSQEIGMTGRGEHSRITTFLNHTVDSELSGNVIDLCPVGALTSKEYRFKARGWELTEKSSIAPHDCLGSNISLHTRRDEVMRVVPRQNEKINEVWISDRDRFSYTGIYHANRIQKPKVKKNGSFCDVSWEEALQYVSKVLNEIGKDMGVLVSPNSTTEEHYLIQKLFRRLQCYNIDHRIRQKDFEYQKFAPEFINLGINISKIDNLENLVLVGSYIHKEQPILGHRIRQASLHETTVSVINPIDFHFNFDVENKLISNDGNIVPVLLSVLKELDKNADLPEALRNALNDVKNVDGAKTLALSLNSNSMILLGTLLQSSSNYSEIISLCLYISKLSGAKFGMLTYGANGSGASIVGCLPHRVANGKSSNPIGLNSFEIQTNKLPGYFLFNLDPELDSINYKQFLENIENVPVIACSQFMTAGLSKVADIILPLSSYAETSGSYINIEGKRQLFNQCINPMYESKPGWKIITAIGNLLGFDFNTNFANIDEELSSVIGNKHKKQDWKEFCPSKFTLEINSNEINLITMLPLNSTDVLVRHAACLQKTQDVAKKIVFINSTLAEKLSLSDGQKAKVSSNGVSVELIIGINNGVPDGSAFLEVGDETTNMFSNSSSLTLN